MKNKKTILIISFILCSLAVLPFYHEHFTFDTYVAFNTNLYTYGYTVMLSQARVTSYLMFVLFNLLKFNNQQICVFNNIVCCIVSSLSILYFYKMLNELMPKSNKIILYLFSFITIINPYTIELFYYVESVSMCLSILFVLLAVKYLVFNKKTNYLLSFIFVLLAYISYQPTVTLFPILTIYFLFMKNKNVKDNYKDSIISIMFFLIIGLLSVFFIKYIININDYKLTNDFRSYYLIRQFKYFIKYFFVDNVGFTLRYFWLYFLIILIILLLIISIIKKKYVYFINYLIITVISIILSILPLLVNGESYVAMRLYIGTITIFILGIIYIYKLLSNKKNILISVLLSIILICDIAVCYRINNNQVIVNNLEKKDALFIKNQIDKYEKNNPKINYIILLYDINREKIIIAPFMGSKHTLYNKKQYVLLYYYGVHQLKDIYYSYDKEIYDNFRGIDFHDLTEKNIIFKDDIMYICLY